MLTIMSNQSGQVSAETHGLKLWNYWGFVTINVYSSDDRWQTICFMFVRDGHHKEQNTSGHNLINVYNSMKTNIVKFHLPVLEKWVMIC